MSLELKAGSTSESLYIFIQDSSSTTGVGLTGLSSGSAGLSAYYVRPLGLATSISLVSQTVTGAYISGGFCEVSAANMPGVYRLDIPDAMIAAGVKSVVLGLRGATNMAPVLTRYTLVAYDPYDTVRLGLTALPNAAVNAANGLFSRGTGTGQINQDADGRIDVNAAAWFGTTIPGVDTVGYPKVTIKDGTGQGEIDTLNGAIVSVVAVNNIASGGFTAVSISADAVTKLQAGLALNATVISASGSILIKETDLEQKLVNVQGRLPAALVSGRMDSSVGGYQVGMTPALSGTLVQADVRQWMGVTPNSLQSGRPDVYTGAMATDVVNAAALASDAVAEIQSGLALHTTLVAASGNIINKVDDVSNKVINVQSRIPAALVSGRMDSSVGAYQSGLTPALSGTTMPVDVQTWRGALVNILQSGRVDSYIGATATDVINANALASDAVTEIQSGLALQTTLIAASGNTIIKIDDVSNKVINIQSRLPAALVSGRMDSSIGAYQSGLTPTLSGAIVQADIQTWRGAVPNTLQSGRVDSYLGAGAANVINASLLASDAVAEIQAGLATPVDVFTYASSALVYYDGPTYAELVSEINSVQSDIAALNNISTAAVKAQVDQALIDINLDHLLKYDVDTSFAVTVASGSVFGNIADTGSGFSRVLHSLKAIRDNGDLNWVTGSGSSSGGVTDWTTLERSQIRYRLGIDGTANVPTASPTLATSGQAATIESYVGNIIAKLPSKSYLTGTNNSDGDIQANEMTGNYPGTVGGVQGNVYGTITGDVSGRVLGTGPSSIIGVGAQVDLRTWLGSAPNSLISGRVDANAQVVGDKTGYALTTASIIDVQSGLASSGSVNYLKTIIDKFDTMVELDGIVYRYTTNALEQAPTGGGSIDYTTVAASVWGYGLRTLTSAVSSISASDIWAYGSRTLTNLGDFPESQVLSIVSSGVFNSTEKGNIRQALGVSGTKISTSGGNLDTILSRIDVQLSTRMASGPAQIDLTQVLGVSQSAGTVGRALQIARAQGRGKWVVNPTLNTLTLYDADNVTAVVVFNLAPAGGPYATRTPTTNE